jgi:tetratricopeptide (TPR) repeat protein/TolB-like protein
MSKLRQLIHEIHRRSLWQVLGIYVVGSWFVLQVVDTMVGVLKLPDWAPPLALILLIIGLPVVLATAFIQEGVRPDAPHEPDQEPAEPSAAEAGSHHRLFTWRNAILGGVAAGLLWGGVAIGWFLFGRGPAAPEAIASDVEPGIAVLPFSVSGPEHAELREGLVHLLSSNLNTAGGLRAIAARTVLAQWDRRIADDERADLDTALGVADASGARYALVGSAVALGPTVRLEGTLHEVPGGASLGSVRVEGSADSVWTLVDGLAVDVVRTLGEIGVGQFASFDLAAATTRSLESLRAYLEGERHFRRGEFDAAQPAFERALTEDSTFALAHLRLSDALGWGSLGSAEIRQHLEAASEGSLPDREALLVRASLALNARTTESLELVSPLRNYVRQHPDDAEAWFNLGDLLLHVGHLRLDDWPDESRRAIERAVELDPGFAPYLIHPLAMALFARDSSRAAGLIEAYGRVRPGSSADNVNRALFSWIFEADRDSVSLNSTVDAWEGSAVYGSLLLRNAPATELVSAYLSRHGLPASGGPCQVALLAGSWQMFLEFVGDPRMSRRARVYCLEVAYITGLPVPVPLFEEALDAVRDTLGWWHTWGAGYAADRGRWEEYEAWRNPMEERLATAEAEGDSAEAGRWRRRLGWHEGYGHWAQGRLDEAAEVFGSIDSTGPLVAWWNGMLALEMERYRDAIRWLSAFMAADWAWPQAALHLGRAHEQLGEREKARESYAFLIDAWKDADPELQPWVQQAREGLERLGPLDQ